MEDLTDFKKWIEKSKMTFTIPNVDDLFYIYQLEKRIGQLEKENFQLKWALALEEKMANEKYIIDNRNLCIKQRRACSLWIEDSSVLDCPLITDEDEKA